MKKYSAYLIDNDDTLMPYKPTCRKALEKVLPGGIDMDNAYNVYLEENGKLWARFEKGGMTRTQLRDQRFVSFLERIQLGLDALELSAAYENAFASVALLFPKTEETLLALSKTAKLYMITNGEADIQRKRVALSGIGKYFDGIFISGEMGAKKPDKEFFDYIIKRTGITIADTLVVGDSPTADIQGGIISGFDTCLVGGGDTSKFKPTYQLSSFANIIDN